MDLEERLLHTPQRIIKKASSYASYKFGLFFGAISGTIIYFQNNEHGFLPAAGGAAKQFLYTTLIAGFNAKICEFINKKLSPGPSKYFNSGIMFGTIIPTLAAFAENYLIHKLGKTPDAFESSIWQVYVNLPGYYILGLYYQFRKDVTNHENNRQHALPG